MDWLTPKIPAANSWVMLRRSSVTTSDTDLNRPNTSGRPREVSAPVTWRTRAVSSVSCSPVSPVIASYRNGFRSRSVELAFHNRNTLKPLLFQPNTPTCAACPKDSTGYRYRSKLTASTPDQGF
ncbi:hypothetical protein AB0E01_40570 [Nocardia vinacea]|uniref:hypothetical protein n=1 Tax=Nocardia vinacea TaxID=96468 RepID=UPI0033FF1C53